jgi:hypothetical protein
MQLILSRSCIVCWAVFGLSAGCAATHRPLLVQEGSSPLKNCDSVRLR